MFFDFFYNFQSFMIGDFFITLQKLCAKNWIQKRSCIKIERKKLTFKQINEL